MRGALVGCVLGWCALAGARLGVVEQSPVLAVRLARAAQAPGEERAEVAAVEPDEALSAPAHVCALAAAGVDAVLGGGGGELEASAAARAGVPLLLTQPAPALRRSWEALALYPHEDLVAEAVWSLCAEKGWRRAVLLHAGGAAPAALLARPAGDGEEPLALAARRLPDDDDDAPLRSLLLVLKRSGVDNFVVWCSSECAVRVLRAAQRAGLMGARCAYVVAAPELHTRDLRPFSHGGANVTAILAFDPESPSVRAAARRWGLGPRPPPASLLLAHDAGLVVSAARRALALPELGAPADCASGAGAFHADTLLNYVRSEEWVGDSGALGWDAEGARRGAALHLAELARGGELQAAGVWTPGQGVSWHRRPQPAPTPPRDSMTNRTFTVLIAKNNPYVMRRESAGRLAGNEQYEGFCIELIQRLAELLHFNYTFEEQDGGYGTYNPETGEWDGMIRRLMDDPGVEFAITDLTITAEREKAVDFTTPFMNLGIAILYHRPEPPEPELFAFLLPFSSGVWLCLGLAYLGTSLLLYVVGRLCPEEWQNPYPCVEEPEALQNQFTLANALWFNLGAVLLQGSEVAPVAYGSRAVASVWWLFALVITSSYTANLATLLAKKAPSETLADVRDLAYNQEGITYGAKAGGSTYTFFEHSRLQSDVYRIMYEHMKEHEKEMPTSNEEGIQRVMKGQYAFLMESTTIDYTVERICDVIKVGEPLDSKGYGIAMKKDSPYRQALNLALLNLQESGVLREMKHTWWQERHGGGACRESDARASSELDMSNFLGLFLVLAVGAALGLLLSCCDLARGAWRATPSPRATRPFTRRLLAELRFVFCFERSVKPLQGPLLGEDDSPASSGVGEDVPPSPTPEEESPAPPRGWSRRRSSMAAASARLARHANNNL